MRSEQTAKSISAAGVSEVPEAVGFTAAWVSEVMLLPGKGVLLLSEWGFQVVVEIPIGESGTQSPIKEGGNLFFLQKASIHKAHKSFESIILSMLVIFNSFLITLANEVYESRLT